MTSYRQCDSYSNDILQRYHPYRQSYTRKKRNVSLVLGHQSMLITIFNTSDSELHNCKMKGSFDQFTCLRINPFHLRRDMLIYTEFKSWVYCAATVEISLDTQILVAPQCAITDSLLNARKSGNVHSSALWLRSCPLLLLLLLLMIMMMTMIVTMMTMMMVMMMIMMMSMMMMMMICMILIIKQVMMPYTSDSLIILTYPKTRHSENKK